VEQCKENPIYIPHNSLQKELWSAMMLGVVHTPIIRCVLSFPSIIQVAMPFPSQKSCSNCWKRSVSSQQGFGVRGICWDICWVSNCSVRDKCVVTPHSHGDLFIYSRAMGLPTCFSLWHLDSLALLIITCRNLYQKHDSVFSNCFHRLTLIQIYVYH